MANHYRVVLPIMVEADDPEHAIEVFQRVQGYGVVYEVECLNDNKHFTVDSSTGMVIGVLADDAKHPEYYRAEKWKKVAEGVEDEFNEYKRKMEGILKDANVDV